jgi:hypothetical protein
VDKGESTSPADETREPGSAGAPDSEPATREPPPPEPPTPPPQPEHHRGVVLLLSAAAVLAALVGARASVLSAGASTAWQEGTRAQVKEAAAYVESIRYIYGVEVPRAVLVTETRFRVQELENLPSAERFSDATQHSIAIEKDTQAEVLDRISAGSTLGSDPKYITESGFDPVRMLIDDRESTPELLEVDPHHEKAEGDEKSEKAIRLVATTIPVALAFLCGSLARGFPRRRRVWLIAGTVALGVAFILAIIIEVS